MQQWEYAVDEHSIPGAWGKALMRPFQEKLAARGLEGWELIGYESVPITGIFTSKIKGYVYLLFWKRTLP